MAYARITGLKYRINLLKVTELSVSRQNQTCSYQLRTSSYDKHSYAYNCHHFASCDKAPLISNVFERSSVSYINIRQFHLSSYRKDKSKLEDSLKEKKKQKQSPQATSNVEATTKKDEATEKPAAASTQETRGAVEPTKQSLWIRFVTEVKHYYHGFRLLALDVRIASRTLWKLLRGKTVVRRERNQFRRAVADIFRLAPFSVFIIIPFAEFALPIALKLFPGMLPSTFETSSKREVRLKKELKVKLEMAKFLQDTVEDIAVHTKSEKKNDAARDFLEFFHKIRSTDEEPTNEEILKHAKLFEDQLTLDNMSRPQLVALCRLIQVPAVGHIELLRFMLQMKLNRLHSDDKLIESEGVDSLTTQELMSACQARGIRALGVPRNKLKQQLSEWVDLHVNHDVPSSLLLLSRVLYMPDTVPVETRVKAAMSTLPEKVAGEAEVRAAEINLDRVDNTTRYKAAKLENAEIADEKAKAAASEQKTADGKVDAKEVQKEEDVKDVAEDEPVPSAEIISEGPVQTDKARVIIDDNKITLEEIDVIDEAISQISNKEPVVSTDAVKSELEDLREDVEEYKMDVESLTAEIKFEKHDAELKDTIAGKRLQKRIGIMIGQIDAILADLKHEEEEKLANGDEQSSVAVKDLVTTLQSLTQLSEDKLLNIFATLDTDKDGHINFTEACNVIKLLNQEDVEVTPKQLEQIVNVLDQQLLNKESQSK